MYAVLSSTELWRTKGALRRGAAGGWPGDDSDRVGGGGAERLVALRLRPVGIAGAGRDGRIRPFSDVGVDGCCELSESIDKLSTFESSEWTLTSSGYNFYHNFYVGQTKRRKI